MTLKISAYTTKRWFSKILKIYPDYITVFISKGIWLNNLVHGKALMQKFQFVCIKYKTC